MKKKKKFDLQFTVVKTTKNKNFNLRGSWLFWNVPQPYRCKPWPPSPVDTKLKPLPNFTEIHSRTRDRRLLVFLCMCNVFFVWSSCPVTRFYSSFSTITIRTIDLIKSHRLSIRTIPSVRFLFLYNEVFGTERLGLMYCPTIGHRLLKNIQTSAMTYFFLKLIFNIAHTYRL